MSPACFPRSDILPLSVGDSVIVWGRATLDINIFSDNDLLISNCNVVLADKANTEPTPTLTPTPTWQEWKESAEEIPYQTLFRYAEEHKGKSVYYRGKVIQVIENGNDFQLRVNVTKGEYGQWDDTVFLRYDDAPVRILGEDIIAFVGTMNGTITYETVLGGEVTIPDITVLYLIIESE